MLSFGCMHPDFDGWKEELARVRDLGLKGIKLHPQYQDTDFDDPRYLRILDRCGELGLVVLTHAGLDIGMPGKDNCAPEMVARVLEQVGPVKLVLAHMGGWRQWDRVEALLPGTGVYLDTSFSLGEITPWTTATTGPGTCPCWTRRPSCAWCAGSGRTGSSSAPTAPGTTRRPPWPACGPCPWKNPSWTPSWAATPGSCWSCKSPARSPADRGGAAPFFSQFFHLLHKLQGRQVGQK